MHQHTLSTDLIESANDLGTGSLLSIGEYLVLDIVDVLLDEEPCEGRTPQKISFGYVKVIDDLLSGDYSNRVHVGDYVVVFRPETLVEWIFRVRGIETATPSGTLLHLLDNEHSLLSEIQTGDRIVLGVKLNTIPEPVCKGPKPVKTSRIRSSSARLEFSNRAGLSAYKIRYKQKTGNVWIEIVLNSGPATFLTVASLEPNTLYEWQVMGYCRYPTEYSYYSTPLTFKTLSA